MAAYQPYPPPPGQTPPPPVPSSSMPAGTTGAAPPPAPAPAPAPAAGNKGVFNYDPNAGTTQAEQFAAWLPQAAAGQNEDFARWSGAEGPANKAQLAAWGRYYNRDASAKAGKPQFTNIYGDIVDKPTERGPNTPPGMNGLGEPGNYGAGGAGGGGGKGGGKGNGASAADVKGLGGKAEDLWNQINNLQSRYSPEVVQQLIAGAKASGAAAGARAKESTTNDFISRGLGRSASSAIAAGNAARGAEAAVVNPAVTSVTANKIQADAQDRIDKLHAMQDWINSSRQYILGSQANANQKAIAMADLSLQEKRLQQELTMQQNSFDFTMANNAYNSIGY